MKEVGVEDVEGGGGGQKPWKKEVGEIGGSRRRRSFSGVVLATTFHN